MGVYNHYHRVAKAVGGMLLSGLMTQPKSGLDSGRKTKGIK